MEHHPKRTHRICQAELQRSPGSASWIPTPESATEIATDFIRLSIRRSLLTPSAALRQANLEAWRHASSLTHSATFASRALAAAPETTWPRRPHHKEPRLED
jgi:hypothetical protein